MLKQIIAIIALSLLVIVGMAYAQQGLQFILTGHDWISDLLKDVFSGGQSGNIVRQLIVLLVIPLCVALVPAIIYWMAKRTWFPYFMQFMWVIWLVQTSALVILYKAG
ncbi:MAG TPA: hypothetical protein VLI69_00875 [Gammaproteobacteria bacterium]|nr:hypothetical protein [Gammaproteobacteria bacterium]